MNGDTLQRADTPMKDRGTMGRDRRGLVGDNPNSEGERGELELRLRELQEQLEEYRRRYGELRLALETLTTIDPTSEMPEMALVADISGVCRSAGTRVITW